MARYYDIRLAKETVSGNAMALVWTRFIPTEDSLPGVYCLRNKQADWDHSTLWNTYTSWADGTVRAAGLALQIWRPHVRLTHRPWRIAPW